ncbi:hypothetical protein EJE24_19605 [Enterobacter huaxiensis]|uniref:Uncharacterized protein n=1 Tax=Enterobacter huaxiensis TaxID=2494702 RepID=A0A428LKQ4_9ENTR|nr:hypothetical protein EJE24_19605 [Enterobacter huaxiensis]
MAVGLCPFFLNTSGSSSLIVRASFTDTVSAIEVYPSSPEGITKSQIYRSVASSTAIKTDESVQKSEFPDHI